MRQLINLYLNKVLIHKEHVEVFFNVLPVYLLGNLVKPPSKDENVAKIGGGGPLVEYTQSKVSLSYL